MQSGISVSKELDADFQKLLSSADSFALLVTIESESLKPKASLPKAGADFAANLSQLTPYVKPDEPLYVLLRRHEAAPHLVAVSYVPDAAKVRQKMLFASTRLTLVRELGSEHFRDTIFATTPEELGPAGFDRHDRHAELDAPLTEEERTLGDVKRAEAEAGAGTGIREIHLSKNMNMPIAADALAAMSELGRGEGAGVVILKINRESEIVELDPTPATPSTVDELAGAIPADEPRFTFFRYTHTHDGSESSPVVFFYTCPAAAGRAIKYRMMYPLMKRAVLTVAESEAGIRVEKKFDVEETSEISDQTVLADLHPQAEVKTGFRRPKRPGR